MIDQKKLMVAFLAGFVLILIVGGVVVWAVRPSDHAAARGAAARDKPFVASSQRPIYHRSDCRWVQEISERNLLGYDDEADAQADGRRACRTCFASNDSAVTVSEEPRTTDGMAGDFRQAAESLDASVFGPPNNILPRLMAGLPVAVLSVSEKKAMIAWRGKLSAVSRDEYARRCIVMADSLRAGTLDLQDEQIEDAVVDARHLYETAYNIADSVELRNRASLSRRSMLIITDDYADVVTPQGTKRLHVSHVQRSSRPIDWEKL